jgi:hypothetical protein
MYLDMNHKTHPIIAAIVLGWSIIYALYMTFVSLLVIGPRDFNGHPNSLSANIVGVTFLVASVSQAIAAIILGKQREVKPFIVALIIAAGSCIVGVVGVGHNFISAINPVVINLLLLLLLFVIQQFLFRSKNN